MNKWFLIGWFLLLDFHVKSFASREGHDVAKILTDCSKKPFITLSTVGNANKATSNIVCQDSLIQLNLKDYFRGSIFQWKKDNIEIPNATDSIYLVSANQAGVYSCTVRMTQLCPDPMLTPAVTITSVSKPSVSVSAGSPTSAPCQEGYVPLTSNVNGQTPFTYQWQREFQPITGANRSTFDAIDTGVYLLKVTDGNGCSNVSGSVNVISNTPPKVEISAVKGGFCKGEEVKISATSGRTYLYQWFRDGQPMSGGKNTIDVNKAGVYHVKVTATNGCIVESLPIAIVEYSDPTVNIVNTGTQLCAGAVLMLSANGTKLKKYQWLRDGQTMVPDTSRTLTAKQAGIYSVTVADSNGCRGTSLPTIIENVDKIKVTLDSIPNFCGTFLLPVMLKGTPPGGIYAGNGVVNATFDPKIAGVGLHTITYTIKGNLDCLNGEAKRNVIVAQPLVLDLGADRQLLNGNSLLLGTDLGADYTYLWTPPIGMNTPNAAQPVFTPERTTTYHVVAKSNAGCVVEDSITIEVFSNIYIPDVFTPNNDGQNDTWLLQGLEEYPEAEVIIFDRWGRGIFYNKGTYTQPFDGTLNNEPLNTGIYAYTIRTQKGGHVFRGNVLLLR